MSGADYAEVDIYAKTLDPLDDFDHDGEDRDSSKPWREAPPKVEWFHGKISREDASKCLIKLPIQSYLVRESVRDVGDFSISFRVSAGVKHFKIIRHEYGDFFVADNRFASLEEVVAHYSNEPLCEDLVFEYPVAPVVAGGASDYTKSVVALVSVAGDGLSELNCTQGERLTVLNDDDANWVYCSQHNGARCGFVPRSCVKELEAKHTIIEADAIAKLPSNFSRSNWIHGKIDRGEAETLLQRDGQVGSFLVRASGDTGSYSLSFRGPRKIQHFRIRCNGEHQYECGGRDFTCLEGVVLRYFSEPLMDSMTLRHPLGCKVMPEQRYDVDGELYSDVQVLTEAAKGLRDGGPPPVPAKPMPIYERVDTLVTGTSKHKAGFIVKKAKRSKKWKAMFFVLLPEKRRLEYFDDESSFKPKGLVDLEAATIFPLDSSYFGRPNCFQIIVQSSEIFLCCNSEAETHEWMAALSEFCGNCGYGRLTSDVSVRSNLKSLNLTIVEAKKFGTKYSMPYCIVNLNQVKLARTPVMQSKSSNPFWNEEFSFDNLSDSVTSVTVVLCNRSRGIKDKQIASLTIPFSDLQKTPELDTWSDLVSDGSKTGSMRIKVGFVNGVLLPLADYAPLTRLLIAPGVAVPLLMAATLKGQMNALSKNLLQVWIATGKVTTYLSTVVQLDVAAETKVATLFRGNSLGTKCMDQFMKIVAMPFLHDAIASPVKKVFEDKRSCELDPTRKGSDANLGVLIEHVIAVMNGIKAAAANCPPELKAALETVRTSTTKHFPDEAMVQYTSVSAFIFLRLICPAILNPKLFNMMPDLPSASTQRNLTLVAKVVQNMANMAEFGAKEPFMEVCNAHIQQQQAYTQRLLINLSTAGPQVRSKVEPNNAGVSQRAHMNIIRQCQKHLADLKKMGTEDAKSLVATLSRF